MHRAEGFGARYLLHVTSMRAGLAAAIAATLLLITPAAAAQPAATSVVVSGVVRDTLARRPVAGAWVQIVAWDGTAEFTRTARSDSIGRYRIDSVPAGRYAIGFFHPLLDSLGVQAATQEVRVGRRGVRVDLATPTVSSLASALCEPKRVGTAGSSGLLLGTVRAAADGAPVPGATVTAEWVEMTLRKGSIERRLQRGVATAGANGAFVLCDVPGAGSLYLRAASGGDSTALVELQVPASGLLRRDLHLGAARAVVRGTVFTADSVRPLGGAHVRVVDGPQTRTNANGEWALTDAPGGTRVLEVRAIGYYPERRAMDVVPDAAPVRVGLFNFQAMLDTVRVVASRVSDRSEGGFARRLRIGQGRFITAEQIARRSATWTSDLFAMTPGVRIDGGGFDRKILVRSAFGGHCAPPVYIDGVYLFTLSADEIDGMITPSRIGGIEIYTETDTPMEFQQGLSGCGAIVIWTKGRLPTMPPPRAR